MHPAGALSAAPMDKARTPLPTLHFCCAPLSISSRKRCQSKAVSGVGNLPPEVRPAISSLVNHARIPDTSTKAAPVVRIAAMAARRDGNPARMSMDIMSWGTPVSSDAAAPPETISDDHPSVTRRVLSASRAQTKRYAKPSSMMRMFSGPMTSTPVPDTHSFRRSLQSAGRVFLLSGTKGRITSRRAANGARAATSAAPSSPNAAASASSSKAPNTSAIPSIASPASSPRQTIRRVPASLRRSSFCTKIS